MNKLEFVQSYITRCDTVIGVQDTNVARELQNEIIGIFESEIDGLTSKLDNYSVEASYISGHVVNYIGDLNLLKQKLTNYVTNLQREKEKAERELELARLKQPNMIQTNTMTVNVTIDQTIELINQIPPSALCDEDKQNLIGGLCDMDKEKKLGNKDKVWDIAKKVLGFIADKGADAAIAAMPLIIKALQA